MISLLLFKSVLQHVLRERKSAKYYAVNADANLYISHKKEITCLLRYILKDNGFEVE